MKRVDEALAYSSSHDNLLCPARLSRHRGSASKTSKRLCVSAAYGTSGRGNHSRKHYGSHARELLLSYELGSEEAADEHTPTPLLETKLCAGCSGNEVGMS